MISAIWAEDENHLIGNQGTLPWHLPEDLKHFKNLTLGKPIVMGRITYEGMGKRALPDRQTIVLTQNSDYNPENPQVIVMQTKAEVLNYAKSVDELMIIGGRHIFDLFMDVTDRVYLTIIHHSFAGDTWMTDSQLSGFKQVSLEKHQKDEKNPYDFSFIEYQRLTEAN
ncbi:MULTISPECIES: dihydrofolate reductase [unclassified Enterococcus]|uniref:dihydrofolate reductase n=1 Tax=unclassified Enterococcus TaxID=2608891 RepID=UPI0015554F36|nr:MULTISPECIES: dihydrofolate reductase [unclassified Enterococcus]MBS7577324.1 dihydrofolate reductase [Enterococcus sp. MMGLQ5-2]MBS7584583.1 dihydrofolate reductase [Enterococcus sp. MMGLQ5-1]NPD12438.1 dihydrofolate reductase [Enterococcus sp. MMGLQ5-1]NPD37158.1 dihydrofolate reductase [Enterococcus sp. MMGLQ5-2]